MITKTIILVPQNIAVSSKKIVSQTATPQFYKRSNSIIYSFLFAMMWIIFSPTLTLASKLHLRHWILSQHFHILLSNSPTTCNLFKTIIYSKHFELMLNSILKFILQNVNDWVFNHIKHRNICAQCTTMEITFISLLQHDVRVQQKTCIVKKAFL